MFKVSVRGASFAVTVQQLAEYVYDWGLDRYAEGRYSWRFALDLMLYERMYGIDPQQVIYEIRALEGEPGCASSTKAAAEFQRPPLRGLWHKHYFSGHFLVRNIQNQWRGKWLTDLVDEIFDPRKSSIVTEEIVKELSHRATVGSFEKRLESKTVTGEWIVFAKHQGKNFYLCMATHSTDDEAIYEAIRAACWSQFPFLVPLPNNSLDRTLVR